ncbi:MAG TPA: chemotaxis protein CheW [Stellaceae bacterium]|jgi:chemotaxis signal transduction protein|nr:chemotaxis protein CheW [Stellaceae bacterium]
MTVGAADFSSLQKWLLFRAGRRLCAVPLGCVAETMRVLPIERARSAGFILGVSNIRGVPVPVVDAGGLFGEAEGGHRRLITIEIGARSVALAVDDVVGVIAIAEDLLEELPPLLREAAGDAVTAIGVLDGEFLIHLEASRLVPDGLLQSLDLARPSA